MRRLVMAMMVAAVAQSAQAADLPDLTDLPILRGAVQDGISSRPARFSGFYVGGQAATGSSDMDFTGATKDVAARLLANTNIENAGQVSDWPVLGKKSKQGTGYGGFAGYNWQWDDVVLGLEGNYVHGNFGGGMTDSMTRFFNDSAGYTDNVTYRADARFNIHDMGSIRARAGWVWNSMMLYGFGGVALGQADVYKSATISGTQVNNSVAAPFNNVPFSLSASDTQNGRFIYGYAAGIGLDVKLVGGLFARGEWEYLKFVGPINTSINTVRGGLGYRF